MGEQGTQRRKPGPRTRLSAEKRARFLEVLGETGNRSLAAEAIGVEPRLMDQRREFDATLDRQWREAVARAERRLAGTEGPLDCADWAGGPDGVEALVIRRGPGGKARIVRAGPRRWSRQVEDRFFGVLAVTGNIRGSARAVGFSDSCIAQRRRKWPDFARKMEEALEDAEIALEFRLASHCGAWGATAGIEPAREEADAATGTVASDSSQGDGGGEEVGTAARDCPEFDADLAIRFLKWREEKRRGGGRRGRMPKPPSIKDVTEKIVRRVEAIKRHRARSAG